MLNKLRIQSIGLKIQYKIRFRASIRNLLIAYLRFWPRLMVEAHMVLDHL